tara:strand:+ start:88 stop:564 length:477 start_codon:yes stop_codon:yes gene_type:complete
MHFNKIDMKKISTLILAVCISSFSAMASGDEAEKIYKALKESQHEVFSMSLAKEMVDFFDMDIDFNGNEQVITGDFSEGKLMILDKGIQPSEVLKLFKKANYKLVELENDDKDDEEGSEIFLYVQGQGKNIKEAHFIIDEEEKTIVFSVFGNIHINKK